MKLQLALDTFALEEAVQLAKAVQDQVDIIEIGTPFLLEYGMDAVCRFRKEFPEKLIFADTKIMDAGKLEATAAFQAGADYVTVLAVTDLATVEECVAVARHFGRKLVADMICVEDIPVMVARLESVGVDAIAVHTGVDQQKQGRTPLGDLKTMKQCHAKAEIFVAGGISLATIPDYAACGPDVLIVGGAIGNAADPVDEASIISEKMKACAGRG